MHAYNQHWFLSAPASHGGHRRIFYQVCNHSDGKSAFRWVGAAFGVTALAQLDPYVCAYKNNYTEGEIVTAPKTVRFQGGRSGSVETWVPKSSGSLPSRIYSEMEAMVKGPDGYVALAKISILIQLEENGSAVINIVSSGEFDDVVIALPATFLDPGELSELVSLQSDEAAIKFAEFSELREDASAGGDSEILTGDIGDKVPSFRLRHLKGEPINARLFVRDLQKFGDVFVSFGRTAGQISVRNDVSLPTPG